jgi:hypothetical protein
MESILSLSSIESYQSVDNESIKCCICSDIFLNKNSYMPECKHSWCIDCNEKLNIHKINNCPICTIKFKSILTKGRWRLKKNKIGVYYWKWEKGYTDSKFKLYKKKILQILSNIFYMNSINNFTYGLSI